MLSLVLVLSLLLGAGVGGFQRSAHGLAAAGQVTLVICGAKGAETVTLDRHGNVTDPEANACLHCPGCLTAVVCPLDAPVQYPVPLAVGLMTKPGKESLPLSWRGVERPARDPPAARRA